MPDNFFFDPFTWKKNAEIQIYEIPENFPKCRHLLHNISTGKMAIAEFIPFSSNRIPKLGYIEKFFDHPYDAPSVICNVMLKNVLLLEDGTLWKIYPPQTRGKSFDQWWNDIKIDEPDPQFFFTMASWKQFQHVQAYFYEEDPAMTSTYLAGQITPRVYLLENQTRGEYAYATPLTFAELIDLYLEYAKIFLIEKVSGTDFGSLGLTPTVK